ncbi:MAG: hypothetical protein AAFW68_08240 [Pseudomonadota bacterium]
MSRMDVTTQELFLRLGTTSQSRSARADALFRRLRTAEQVKLSEDLLKTPRKLAVSGDVSAQSEKSVAPSSK